MQGKGASKFDLLRAVKAVKGVHKVQAGASKALLQHLACRYKLLKGSTLRLKQRRGGASGRTFHGSLRRIHQRLSHLNTLQTLRPCWACQTTF